MTEYWLISAPGDKTCQQTWETMNNLTSKQNSLSVNYKFPIPDLKVGTLDQLVGLSDDLGKLDTYVEQVTRKVATYLGEVLEDQRDKLHENLMANNSQTSMDGEAESPGEGGPDTPPNTPVTPSYKAPGSGKLEQQRHWRDTDRPSAPDSPEPTTCLGQKHHHQQRHQPQQPPHHHHRHHRHSHRHPHPHHHHHHHHRHPNRHPHSSHHTYRSTADDSRHRHRRRNHNHRHHHHHHHQQRHHEKKAAVSASSAASSSGACEGRAPGDSSSSIYSCYQAHWCAAAAASTPSTPSPRQSPSPRSSSSSSCSCSRAAASSSSTSSRSPSPSRSHSSASASSASSSCCCCCCSGDERQQQPQQEQGDQEEEEEEEEEGTTSWRSRRRRGRRRGRHKAQSRGGSSSTSSSAKPQAPRPLQPRRRERRRSSRASEVTEQQQHRHRGQNDQDEEQEPDVAAAAAAAGKLPNPGDLPTYITRFQWDAAKYPIKQSLKNIADIISKQVGQIDADLKTKSTTYNNLKGSLQNLEKKQSGSLLTRNLADLVRKEHFILDSEYLTTLLVIVPRASFQEWNALYEKLTDMIVPRSSQLITQDQEYGLFTVTLFKKVIEEFKLHAREKKFIVRDFTYNEEELAAGKNEMTKLVTDKKKQFGPLVRWLKVNFSECFCAWIHVKALRVFVESVLRYGLPVNFQAILLRPNKKSTKRLRDVLNQLYAHLDSSATAGGSQSANQDSVDIPGLGFGQSDYFPYVYYKINVDMVDNKV